MVGGEAKRWARRLERAGRTATETRAARRGARRHPAPGGAVAGAGGGGPPPVGPGPAVRHDRQRPRGRPRAGPWPSTGPRSPICGPASTWWPAPTPTPPSPPPWTPTRSPRRRRRTGPWPSRTTSGTRPSGRSNQAAALLFCSVGRPLELGVPTDRWAFPVGRAGVEPRRVVAAPLGPPHLAGHGRCSGRPPPSGWGVRWPRPRPSSSTAAFPPPSACNSGCWAWTPDDAHGHRGDGLRRGTVQQLRLPVHGPGDPDPPGRARRRWGWSRPSAGC